MNKPIVPIQTAIQTFRDSGYKNTASAISEIIDNSIEAEANNITILVVEEDYKLNGKLQKKISKIAIVDDGIGMNEEVISTSLQFGNGTKQKSREGIGRFGIGLPNASVSQCKKVDVYSWQKSKCLHTYLDCDESSRTGNQNINSIIEDKIPDFITNEIKVGKNGTAIIWSKCDRLNLVKAETLYNQMSRDLCRVFRHFLDNDGSYGKKVNIKYKIVGTNFEKSLKANDPIYLITPNNTPGYEDEAIMELKTDINDPKTGKIEVAFIHPITGKPATSNVLFKFTFIKQEIRDLEHGDSKTKTKAFLDHLRRNIGISFVRAGREVDFGNFGYFTPYDTTERWWGCEIQFEPELDEFFGVTINKQHVREMGPITPDMNEDEITEDDIKDKPKLYIRREITKRFTDYRSKYMSQGRASQEGKRSKQKRSISISERVFKQRNIQTRSKVEGGLKTEKQIEKEWQDHIAKYEKLTGTKYSVEEIKKIIEANKKLDVGIEFIGWPGSQFYSTEIIGKTATVKLNTDHKFYTKLYSDLAKSLDTTNVEIVDFLMISWARLEDELSITDIKVDDFIKIRERWGQQLTDLLNEQEKLQ